MKLTTHLHLVPRSRCVELYLHSPNTPSRRGARLESTGTTLPLPYHNPLHGNIDENVVMQSDGMKGAEKAELRLIL